MNEGLKLDFSLYEDGILRFRGRVYILNDVELKQKLLGHDYQSKFTIHLGGMKMYKNLKDSYYWNNMKKDITTYVSRCLVC